MDMSAKLDSQLHEKAEFSAVISLCRLDGWHCKQRSWYQFCL